MAGSGTARPRLPPPGMDGMPLMPPAGTATPRATGPDAPRTGPAPPGEGPQTRATRTGAPQDAHAPCPRTMAPRPAPHDGPAPCPRTEPVQRDTHKRPRTAPAQRPLARAAQAPPHWPPHCGPLTAGLAHWPRSGRACGHPSFQGTTCDACPRPALRTHMRGSGAACAARTGRSCKPSRRCARIGCITGALPQSARPARRGKAPASGEILRRDQSQAAPARCAPRLIRRPPPTAPP